MWTNDNENGLTIGALGASACVELFGAYGVELSPGSKDWGNDDERMLSGSVGFVGRRVRGTCLLAAPTAPLELSCPEQGGALRDWVGELANQFVGRLKSKLLARGVEIFMTTPIVLSGVRIQPLPRGKAEPFVFTSNAGDVLAWIEVETEGQFEIGAEQADGSNGEGDVIVL